MRTGTFLLCLMVGLIAMGSDCINEDVLIVADLPLEACFPINPGSDLSFDESKILTIEDELDESIEENITEVRYYDIRVKVLGTYDGSVSGVAKINGIDLLTFNGRWSDFSEYQSLLGSSPHITPVQAGILELLRVLALVLVSGPTTVTLSATGSLSGESPVPSGLSVCVQVLGQVDATVN